MIEINEWGTPWRAREFNERCGEDETEAMVEILDYKDDPVTGPVLVGSVHDAEVLIHERIVACVNAMAGIDDPAELVERAKAMEEALRIVAMHFCTRCPDDTSRPYTRCSETGDCVTEWCPACVARAALAPADTATTEGE